MAPVGPDQAPPVGALTAATADPGAVQPAPQAPTTPAPGGMTDDEKRRRDGLLGLSASFLNGSAPTGALSNVAALAGMLRR